MNILDITRLSGKETREKLISKEISSREIVEAYLEKIEEKEKDLNAFITITREEALAKAGEIDKKIKNGEKLGPLAGIPIGIKDNIVTKDIRTTCGSKMLKDFIPPYDATVVEEIKSKDGIIIGKTNMDEFAMGFTNESSYFGPSKNPIDLEKVPGGSSGGSAAGVRAYEMPLALGSDTGGSVRQPASFCGLVGIRPTYGLVSRYGLVALGNSLDTIGTLSRTVEDGALLLEAIAGYDRRDSTSVKRDREELVANLEGSIKGEKIAVPKEFLDLEMEAGVKKVFKDSIKRLEKLGATIDDVSLPYFKYALATYSIITKVESSSSLSRFDGIRYGHRTGEHKSLDQLYMDTRGEGFGSEVKKRILEGVYFASKAKREEYYIKALKLRSLIIKDLEKIYKDYNIILSPTNPVLAFKLGEKPKYPTNIFTVLGSLGGLPAISIPAGLVDGLPVGIQLIGNKFTELQLLNVALAFENDLDLGGEVNEI